jgi:hypothetical protein
MTMLPFTQSCLEDHEGELQYIPWPAQSPDLNITEPLWSVLETGVRKRFPPLTPLMQLKGVLQEEWYVQNLNKSIPRSVSVLRA